MEPWGTHPCFKTCGVECETCREVFPCTELISVIWTHHQSNFVSI